MTDLHSRLGETLGSTYRLERELGGGGMSRVFLAEEVALGRKVVIKVLPPEMAAGVNQERFRREIQLAARLQHPHIVPLLSAGSAGDTLYYVMPYIEGESLRVKLAREGELPVAEAVRIVREVTDALAYAHEQGVVHRDIKPDNVMLSRGHALVTDFGVAKAVSESTGGQSLTSLGVALGTPAYMAPEQASADPHVDHRADLYSLGALAYEMLAGRPPFVGGSPQAMLMAHVAQTPEKVGTYRPAVPPVLETVVMRCLEKHAADRWQHATELLPHLDALLTPTAGMAPATAPVTAISSGSEAALRNAHPVRVAVLFAVASLVVLSLTSLLERQLGLPGWVTPVAGVLLVLGLPIMLLTARRERDRIVARSTGTHSVDTGGLAGKLFTWRGALAGGGLALGGLALGTGAFMALRTAGVGPFATLVTAGVLNARDPLVLADFDNRTTDSTLGTSITQALRIDLTRSPVVRLLETNAVAATLRRMQRDPASGLTEPLAREVAQREGAKGVVAGEIAPLGSGFVLSARVVSASDSSTLIAERETATDAAAIIPAVERLSKKLREGIGESLRTIRNGQPLERVSTSSLAALRAYSEGSRASDQGVMLVALTHFREAVALDSNFGMAWRKIGVVLSNTQADRAQMLDALRRAYDLRDRMPPLEAAQAVAFYYTRAVPNRPKAIEAYQTLLASWPDDGIALNNLSLTYYEDGRFGDAEQTIRRAVALQPDNAIYNTNLLSALASQGRLAAAESAQAAWASRAPQNVARLRMAAQLAREQGQYDRALAYADSAADPTRNGVIPGNFSKAETLRWLGRFREAERATAKSMEVLEQRRGFPLWIANALSMAHVESFILDRPDVAVQRIDAALARHPLDSIAPASRPYGRVITELVSAGRLDRAQALQTEYERVVPRELRDTDGWSFYGRAQLALARGDAKSAMDGFRAAKDLLGCQICTSFDEGRAFERLSQPDSAIARYEREANAQLLDADNRDITLAAALRRLGQLYESKGNRQKALEYYGRFVDLWKNADSELQPLVKDVRRHMAELAGEPKR